MTEDFNELEEQEFSYVPEDIEYVKEPGKPGYHVDPVTGKQTYPSWYKRSQRRFFSPEELDMRSRRPGPEDVRLCRRIMGGLSEIPEDGVGTRSIIELIKEIEGVIQRDAYAILYERLWCTGLLKREGVMHRQSGRPMKQKWFFTE